MFVAYRRQGGPGELRLLPALVDDDHALFARRGGIPEWRPLLLDGFLQQHRLLTWDAPPAEPAVADLPPPEELAPHSKAHWLRYLEAADNKACAVSPAGRFAWRSGHDGVESARAAALGGCGHPSCRLVSENDVLTGS